MRRIFVFLVAAMLLLPTAAPAADPYEINVITSLTGPAGFLGQAQQGALRALEAKVNKSGGIEGRPIKFVIHDDATVPQNAVQLVNQLIAEKVPYFLGPALVQQCLAVAPLIKDNGPVAIASQRDFPPAASNSRQ